MNLDIRALAFQTLGDTWGVDVPEERLKAFAKAVRNAALLEAAEIAMNAHVPFGCEEGEVCAAEAIKCVAEGLCA